MLGRMIIGSVSGAVIGSFFLGPFGLFAGSFIGGAIGGFAGAEENARCANAKKEALSKINPHGSATEIAYRLKEAGLTEIEFRQFIESRDGKQTITDERLRRVSRR